MKMTFKPFFKDGLPVRILILFGSLACLLFGFMLSGDDANKPITYSNYIQFVLGIILFIISLLVTQKDILTDLGYLFIFQFNIINVLIIYLSGFNDIYAYQYIVFFLVSSWFFETRKSFLLNIGANFFAVAVIILFNADQVHIAEFLITYSVAIISLLVLVIRSIDKTIEIKESESRYRLLAEHSADLICTHNQGGDFDFVSPSVLNITGFSPDDLRGKNPSEWIHPDDRKFFIENFFSSYKPSYFNNSFQFRFLKKDGQYIWLDCFIKAISKDEIQGVPAKFLSQSRSFQKHKEYEEEILLKSQELERKNKEVEMFAYITSHDMQEPLRMITNYLQLVQTKLKKVGDESLNEFINYAVSSSKNLQSLVKDILIFSTADKIVISKDRIDVEPIIKEIIADIQIIVEEKDVKIDLPSSFISLKADKVSIRQLFQNIIINGIRYNTSSQPLISISCENNNGTVIYSISDNGVGIEKHYWDKIFEPFQRLQSKTANAGTGLGLPICKKIMEKIGGKVWVESEKGKGSTFFLSFPLN